MEDKDQKNKFPFRVVAAYTAWQASRSEIDFQAFLESLRQNATLVPKGIVSGDVRSALTERFAEAAALPGFREAVDSIIPGRPPETSTPTGAGGLQVEAALASIPIAHRLPDESNAVESRKPRKKIVALIAALVSLVACAGAFTAYALSAGLIGDRALIRQAETHYAAARSAITAAASAIDGVRVKDSDEISIVLEGDTDAIRVVRRVTRVARKEIAAARASIERLGDSRLRRDYLSALGSLSQAADRMEESAVELSVARDVLGMASDAADMAQQPEADLREALSADDSSDYARVLRKAKAASYGFAEVVTLLRRTPHRLDPSGRLDRWVANVNGRRKMAEILIGMAVAGSSRDERAYSAGVARLNRVIEQISKFDESEIITKVERSRRQRALKLGVSASAALEKADGLRAQALKASGYRQ